MFKIYNSKAISRTERFTNALTAGIVASLICLLASFIQYKTGFISDYFLLAYGYFIGWAIQYFGKGVHKQFAILAVGLYVVVVIVSDLLWCNFEMEIFMMQLQNIVGLVVRAAGGYLSYRYSRIVG